MRTKRARDLDKLWNENKLFVLQVLKDVMVEKYGGGGEIFENSFIGIRSKKDNPFNLAFLTSDEKTKICVCMDPRGKGKFTIIRVNKETKKHHIVNGIDGVYLHDKILSILE